MQASFLAAAHLHGMTRHEARPWMISTPTRYRKQRGDSLINQNTSSRGDVICSHSTRLHSRLNPAISTLG